MEIKIIKSRNRRKTISAKLVGDVIQVNAPSGFPDDKLNEIIEKLKKRIIRRKQKKELNSQVDLAELAAKLNKQYFNGEIKIESIEYSTDQSMIFGSCSHHARAIRISHRLAQMPDWVRDYVIVHEMAHILEPNHGRSFWALVNRYPLTERARGYLMAKGMQEN